MEKKDWEKELSDRIIWLMGRRSLRAVDVIEDLLPRIDIIIEEELSKAREEGRVEERDRIFWELDRINCVDEALPKNYSAAGMQFGINRVKEIVLQEELSKLKEVKENEKQK